jgi:hypothetical protein
MVRMASEGDIRLSQRFVELREFQSTSPPRARLGRRVTVYRTFTSGVGPYLMPKRTKCTSDVQSGRTLTAPPGFGASRIMPLPA